MGEAVTDLNGKTAVVTGASQGIGRSIASALHGAGARLALIGRSRSRLEASFSNLLQDETNSPLLLEADLLSPVSLRDAANEIMATLPSVDILVNCGGAYLRNRWDEADPGTFNDLLTTNVIGPYSLTRLLLPKLAQARGDVVFVNSSITRSQGDGAAHYKATQHALQAVSDSLRTEFNPKGIRVLSVYPGRTATPRQERIYASEGRDYRPDSLLQSSEIADTVLFCLNLPETAEITDIYIRPRFKS